MVLAVHVSVTIAPWVISACTASDAVVPDTTNSCPSFAKNVTPFLTNSVSSFSDALG